MEKKEFKTYNKQLRILRSRGVKITNGSKAKRILENENYYNVINGYKSPFLLKAESELYKSNTDFREINALYEFDRNIRIIYLKYLLKIENNFKSIIAYNFSEKYGYDNYLKIENFENGPLTDDKKLRKLSKKLKLDYETDIDKIKKISEEKNVAKVTKLIGDIQQELARQLNKNHQAVKHYMVDHGYIPLWVLVNVLTFGKITSFYDCLKQEDKDCIARHFKVSTHAELHKYMCMLGLARNMCAHDERFYDVKFKKSLHMKSIQNIDLLELPRDAQNSYIAGTNDAFAIAIIFSKLLKMSELKEFISLMSKEFEKLRKKLTTINIEEIYNIMGYPKSWKNLVNMKKLNEK